MKPIRVTGDPNAVLGDAVNRLVREFEYPSERTPGAGIEVGGGGGAPTIVVAASDSSELSQSKADIIVPAGSVINDPLAEACSRAERGEVILCESPSDYMINATSLGVDCASATIRGLNAFLQIVPGTTGVGLRRVKRISNLDMGGHANQIPLLSEAFGMSIFNCFISNSDPAWPAAAIRGGDSVSNCKVGSAIWIWGRGTTIVGNQWAPSSGGPFIVCEADPDGFLPESRGHEATIVGNAMDSGGGVAGDRIVLNDVDEVVIAGNVLSGLNGTNLINMVNSRNCYVGGNDIKIASSGHTIVVNGSDDCTIEGNQITRRNISGGSIYDVIHVTGASERLSVINNAFTEYETVTLPSRYGIFLDTGVLDTAVLGNVSHGSWGTGFLLDNGTGTITTYNGPGDNATI